MATPGPVHLECGNVIRPSAGGEVYAKSALIYRNLLIELTSGLAYGPFNWRLPTACT